jgi:hypothetical protein
MSRSTYVVLAVVALAAIALATVPVATAKTCGMAKSSPGCSMGGVKSLEKHEVKMAKAIEKCEKAVAGLYKKYEDEFVAIHEKHEAKIVELAEKIESLEREIEEITMADEPDLRKLESNLRKISELRLKRTELRFRMHKEARAAVDESDRLALDRHFAMGVGCCGGMGMQATYHPNRETGKFEMKVCCPGGMAPRCGGKAHMKACCPGGMPGHGADKMRMKACCPGHKGHASMAGPRAMFVGEEDGHVYVEMLDDVDGLLGCAPGTLGEKHVEVLVDEEGGGVRRLKVLVDGEHDELARYEIMLDEEDLEDDGPHVIKRIRKVPGGVEHLEGEGRDVIKRVHVIPGGGSDDLIWMERGSGTGPF